MAQPLSLLSLHNDVLSYLLEFVPTRIRFTVCPLVNKRFRKISSANLAWARKDPLTLKQMSLPFFLEHGPANPEFIFQINPAKVTRASLCAVVETPENTALLRIAKLIASQYLLNKYLQTKNKETPLKFLSIESRIKRFEESRDYLDILFWSSDKMQAAALAVAAANRAANAEQTKSAQPAPPSEEELKYFNPSSVDGTDKCFRIVTTIVAHDFLKLKALDVQLVYDVFSHLTVQKNLRNLFALEGFSTSFQPFVFKGICQGLQKQTGPLSSITGVHLDNDQLAELGESLRNKTIESLCLNLLANVSIETLRKFSEHMSTIKAEKVHLHYHNHAPGGNRCPREMTLAFMNIASTLQDNGKIEQVEVTTCPLGRTI